MWPLQNSFHIIERMANKQCPNQKKNTFQFQSTYVDRESAINLQQYCNPVERRQMTTKYRFVMTNNTVIIWLAYDITAYGRLLPATDYGNSKSSSTQYFVVELYYTYDVHRGRVTNVCGVVL